MKIETRPFSPAKTTVKRNLDRAINYSESAGCGADEIMCVVLSKREFSELLYELPLAQRMLVFFRKRYRGVPIRHPYSYRDTLCFLSRVKRFIHHYFMSKMLDKWHKEYVRYFKHVGDKK